MRSVEPTAPDGRTAEPPTFCYARQRASDGRDLLRLQDLLTLILDPFLVTVYDTRMVKSVKERVTALRERRKRDGWVQLNVWVKREWVARVRKYVARLAKGEK